MKKWKIGIIGVVAGMAIGVITTWTKLYPKLKKAQELGMKNGHLLRALADWMKLKQEGKDFSRFFVENEYKTIAIYGMSFLGERLLKELESSEVTVAYAIDKNANDLSPNSGIKIVGMDGDLEEVDVIVVTPIFYYNEVEEELLRKIDCPVISLEDIIYDF